MEEKNIVHFLKADSGDCFLIQLADKNCILIDGGYKSTFQSELKPLLKELSDQNYRVALFIVTHFDEDHIGGAITFIEENGDSNNPNIIPVDNIWFNGIFQLIMRDKKMLNHLVEQLSEAQKDIYQILAAQLSELIGVGAGKISATQAEAFETLCVENHYKMNAGGINGQVINGASLQIGDCIIRCLNPDDIQLNRLSRWIDKKCIDCLGNDYELDKNGFIAFLQRILIVTGKEIPQCTGVWKIASDIPNIDDWVNTSSLAPMNEVNRSSIVVEVNYKDIRMLFIGDSESKDWVANAHTSYDLVKISHHGTTKPNLEIIEKIKIKSALISTNGRKNQHPEDDLLARMVKAGIENIYFNYDIRRKNDLQKIQEQYSFNAHFGEKEIII